MALYLLSVNVYNCWFFYVHRQKDLETFLEHTRAKFVGFQVPNDCTSLAGLPQPIHEGVKVLRQVAYINKL